MFSYDDELDDYDTFGKEENAPVYIPPVKKDVNGSFTMHSCLLIW